MNWAWLISNVDKYKPLLNYINKHTPKLNSNKYLLTTKMKWILEGLTDFPKCANPHCSQILYNATSRTLVDDMTKYCSQKCVQESKSHKPHSFFVKRKYKQCIKYLNSIFESKESKYKIQYLKIIDKYLKLKLKKSKESNDVLNYVEKHHINPRWYFISNCIPIIDHDNIVIVPYYIHVKLHILLVQHFKYINDKRNYYKAVRACLAFYNTYKSSIRSLIRLPVKIQKQLEKIKQQYSKIQSVYSKSRKTVINIKTNQIKTVPFSYTNDNYEVLYINIDI